MCWLSKIDLNKGVIAIARPMTRPSHGSRQLRGQLPMFPGWLLPQNCCWEQQLWHMFPGMLDWFSHSHLEPAFEKSYFRWWKSFHLGQFLEGGSDIQCLALAQPGWDGGRCAGSIRPGSSDNLFYKHLTLAMLRSLRNFGRIVSNHTGEEYLNFKYHLD